LFAKILWRLYGWYSPPAESAQDVAELFERPGERLARGPVELGPVRTAPCAAAILLLLAYFVLAFVADPKLDLRNPSVQFVAIAVLVAVLVTAAAVWLWRVSGSRLVLDTKGARFRTRRTEIFCPWSLFNAAGGPFVDPNVPHRIQIPINPGGIPDITLTRPNRDPKTATDVKTDEFRFDKRDSLKVSLVYAIDATTLARLLLHLGRHFAENPTTPAVPAARRMPVPDERAGAAGARPIWTGGEESFSIDHKEWITMDAVRAQFPPMCCLCGGATDETYRLAPKVRYLGFFEGNDAGISVPCCPPCQRTLSRLQWRGRWLVLGICVSFGLFVLLWGYGFAGFVDLLRKRDTTLFVWPVVSLILLRIFWRFADEMYSPVYARYHPQAKRFSFWFRQPGYALQICEYLRNPSEWSRPADDADDVEE
jgi:hypothetical protein